MGKQDVTGSGNITGGRDAVVSHGKSEGPKLVNVIAGIGSIAIAVAGAFYWAWDAGFLDGILAGDTTEKVEQVETLPPPVHTEEVGP